jgi:hypothetical protein
MDVGAALPGKPSACSGLDLSSTAGSQAQVSLRIPPRLRTDFGEVAERKRGRVGSSGADCAKNAGTPSPQGRARRRGRRRHRHAASQQLWRDGLGNVAGAMCGVGAGLRSRTAGPAQLFALAITFTRRRRHDPADPHGMPGNEVPEVGAVAADGAARPRPERVNDFGTPCVMRLASKEL